MTAMIRALLLLLFLVLPFGSPSRLVAEEPPRPESMERMLLPITVRDLPGAFGTLWTVDLWLKIDGDHLPQYVPAMGLSACDPPCPDPSVITPDTSFPVDFYRTHAEESPGQLLYVDPAATSVQHFSLRLRERSGALRMQPLQLPIVPAREFRTDAIQILGVSTNPDTRVMLRVYGIDPERTGSVRVRAYREDGPLPQSLIFERTVNLTVKQVIHFVGDQPFAVRPPAAELNLTGLEPPGTEQYRLELTPQTDGLQIWGFVSLTDNATQTITLRTP
jgi:hypothetical protein